MEDEQKTTLFDEQLQSRELQILKNILTHRISLRKRACCILRLEF